MHLDITLIQTDLSWQDRDSNIQRFEKHLENVGETDLVVLPEMFTTGFSMKAESFYEEEGGPTLQWMLKTSAAIDAAICGSVITKEGDHYFNRLFFVLPSGHYYKYDKRHLFTLANEQDTYTAGKESIVVEYKGWKIKPLICYDLRFPVWCRNKEEADVMLFVANWPERRSDAWKTLLKARAIENMCYVAGVNRVGNDGNEVYHSGNSGLYDELGRELLKFEDGSEGVKTYKLDHEKMMASRKRFNFLNDRDDFTIAP